MRAGLAGEVREGSLRRRAYAGREVERGGESPAEPPRDSRGSSTKSGGRDGYPCADGRYSVHLSRTPHKPFERLLGSVGSRATAAGEEGEAPRHHGEKPVRQGRCSDTPQPASAGHTRAPPSLTALRDERNGRMLAN